MVLCRRSSNNGKDKGAVILLLKIEKQFIIRFVIKICKEERYKSGRTFWAKVIG